MAWEGLNRRRFPRAKFPCLVKIAPRDRTEEPVLAHTENIAVGGMCVILKKGLPLFTPVLVELDLLDGEDHVLCEAKVVWSVRRKAVEPEKPSFYDLGIEFVNLKDVDYLRIERTIEHLVRGQQRFGL